MKTRENGQAMKPWPRNLERFLELVDPEPAAPSRPKEGWVPKDINLIRQEALARMNEPIETDEEYSARLRREADERRRA